MSTGQTSMFQKKQREKLGVTISVVALCLLALVPTAKAIVENQMSSRYVMQAIESLEKGDFEESQKSLEQAKQWSDKVTGSRELEVFNLQVAILKGESEKAIARVTRRQDIDRFVLAYSAYNVFNALGDFANALVCAKVLVEAPAEAISTAEKLNQTAYLRSLAKVELDQALKDIETAVKLDNNPSVVDTQAWVLHQLGRHEEALPLVNDAIERATKEQDKQKKAITEASSPAEASEKTRELNSKAEENAVLDDINKVIAKDPNNETFKSNLRLMTAYLNENKNPLKSIAVMRYHRALIREALTQDASEDRKWLEENGFTDLSLLY